MVEAIATPVLEALGTAVALLPLPLPLENPVYFADCIALLAIGLVHDGLGFAFDIVLVVHGIKYRPNRLERVR